MARTDTLANFVTDVANAIRTKSGKSDLISPSNFDNEIINLPSGGGDGEDVANEVMDYNTKLTEQEELIKNISNALKNKVVSTVPEKGFVVDQWDEEGFANQVTVVGFDELPGYGLAGTNGSRGGMLSGHLEKVIIPDHITKISDGFFYWCINLTSINGHTIDLPNHITDISGWGFYGCKKLGLKMLPASVKSIGKHAFYMNNNMVQLSMPNIETIYDDDEYTPFRYCENLKALWIGASIAAGELSSNTLSIRGATSNYNYIKYIFIDLPLATVQKFAGYGIGFGGIDGSRKPTIICNDNAKFMSKEEFDAIDWSTYTL